MTRSGRSTKIKAATPAPGWRIRRLSNRRMTQSSRGLIGKPGSDFHYVAIVESPLPRNLDPKVCLQATPYAFARTKRTSMSMDVNTAGTSLLVVSEVFYPGWKATVNGQAAEIHKTDGALRGILVPAGFSHVVMKYSPASFYVGIGLTLLAMGGVVVCSVLIWRSNRPYRPAR